MRKALVCLLAAAALTPAAAAPADPYKYFHVGRCEIEFPTTIAQSYLYAAVVVYALPLKGNPVTADVTCSIRYNGSVIFSRTSSGETVVEQAGPVNWGSSYADDDVFTICTEVDFTSSIDAPVQTECYDIVRHTVGEKVADPVNLLVAPVVDPVLCPQLAANPVTVGRFVKIDGDGDVYVLQEKTWDCPPYGP